MTNSEKLNQLTKANQAYKLKLATKAGFSTVEEYKKFLKGIHPIEAVIASAKKQTIHLVDVLDSSGSMNVGKYANATRGIMEGIKEFSKNTEVNYTYSLIEFVQKNKIIEHQYVGPFLFNPRFYGAHGADTPLYKTLYDTLTKLKALVKDDENVLVKAYTDGGNNTAIEYGPICRELIAELQQKNFTITLVGPANELREAIQTLGLSEDNTLAVENTASGFRYAFEESLIATRGYASKVAKGVKGDELLKGFYGKKVGKL